MATTIIDSHCHYNLEPFYPAWHAVWEAALDAGVIAALVVGTDAQSSKLACEIAAIDKRLLAAIGIHPTEAGASQSEITLAYLHTLYKSCRALSPVAAIGETGLDYFRLAGSESELQAIKQKQQRAFTAHLMLASELALPVTVHVRDAGEAAYADVIQLLQPYASKLTIILHCFSGPEWYLQQALALGCYISFAGNITYSSAQNLRSALKLVPPDRLLVETDAPFLPPQQHRGQRNETKYIAETVQYMQNELQIDPQQLVNNARAIFTTIPTDI